MKDKVPSLKINIHTQNSMANLPTAKMDITTGNSKTPKNPRSPWYGKPTFSNNSDSNSSKK